MALSAFASGAQLDDPAWLGALQSAPAPDARWTDNGLNQFVGGIATNEWTTANQIVGTYSTVNDGVYNQIRCPGTVTHLHWWCRNIGAPATYKIKLLRPAATNVYDVIYATDALTATVGTNSVTGLNWAVQEGDQLAWWAQSSGTECYMTLLWSARYASGEASGTSYTSGSRIQDGLNIAAYGLGPAIAYTGDSILTGYPHYGPWLSLDDFSDRQGMASNSVPWKVKNEQGITAVYGDYCTANIDARWINLTNMTFLTNASPKMMWLHIGINDVNNGTAWASYETNLIAIRNKFGTNNPFFIAEIFPATSVSDAVSLGVRTWNTNLAHWVTTNFASLVAMHDAFGSNRSSTGMLDNLKAEYSLDGVHLTTAGLAEYARWVRTNLSPWVK